MIRKIKEAQLSYLNNLTFLDNLEESQSFDTNNYATSNDLFSLDELEDKNAVVKRLKKIDWSFHDYKTNYLSHDIHPYPAKFIPQIPQSIIALLSIRGEIVWDPFGGSGTTALESILFGRRAISTDVNPLSEIIGRAKTLTLNKEDESYIENLIEELAILSNNSTSLGEMLERTEKEFYSYIPEVPNLFEWFHKQAVSELAYLRWRIEQLNSPKVQVLARVCFSKTILKASFQDEETRYARKPREVNSGEVIYLFVSNLAHALKKAKEIAPLLRFREAQFITIDLRENVVGEGSAITPNSIDLVVTSPPYPNSTDYHLYHRFRLFWLGFDPREFGKREIGSHLRHQRESSAFDSYLDEMSLVLNNIKSALKPGRFAVLVLGDAVFQGKTYKTASGVAKVAKKLGFEFIDIIQRPVHSTKRSFIAAGRRADFEDLLILRKPKEDMDIVLYSPPYTLWQYEQVLRKKEIETVLNCKPKKQADGTFLAHLSSLSLDKLRRLTFTHSFGSTNLQRELTWQAVLENGDAFDAKTRRKDPRYATHGIHEYKGKFYPQLAKSLFNLANLQPGQKVLDPFCGSGTVLLESYLNGLTGFGFDMNPMAIKISHAKLSILEVDPYLRDRLLAKFLDRLAFMDENIKWINRFPSNLHDEIRSWFPDVVIGKLGWLYNEIALVPDTKIREFLEVLVSSIVRNVSQQDPKDLRIRRRAEPLTDAPVKELFEQKLREQRVRLQYFAQRSNRCPYPFNKATAISGDSRNWDTFKQFNLTKNSIDAVVTSPPYATALPYIDTDRLSILLILGVESNRRSILEESITGSREIKKKDKNDLEDKIDSYDWGEINSPSAQKIVSEVRKGNLNSDVGFRKQNMAALLYRYFSDMSLVAQNLNKCVKPDGSVFFVIGDTKTEAGDKWVSIKSGQVLKELGLSLGWELVDVIPITVTTEDRPHSKNSITENDIIWFKKNRL